MQLLIFFRLVEFSPLGDHILTAVTNIPQPVSKSFSFLDKIKYTKHKFERQTVDFLVEFIFRVESQMMSKCVQNKYWSVSLIFNTF